MQILIVDDDKIMTSLLSRLLELEGINSVTINGTSIEELLQYLQEINFDLILMDIFLKAFNGLSALKTIRENKNHNVPILMTSGMDLKSECIAAGADDFLQKPFMPEELLGKIRYLGKASL